MSADDVVFTGWLVKSPPEKKLNTRYVSVNTGVCVCVCVCYCGVLDTLHWSGRCYCSIAKTMFVKVPSVL